VGGASDIKSWISGRLDPLAATDAGRHWHPDGSLVDAAVLVPIVEREDGLSVILTRRAGSLRDHTGEVALPGGRRDPGETPGETALREAEEEIGLDRSFVSLAGLSTTYVTPSFRYHLVTVVGFVRPGFTLSPNPHEVAHVFEAPFGFLMDPSNYEVREGVTPLGDVRRFYALAHGDELIFGVTAGILRKLYERLYGAA